MKAVKTKNRKALYAEILMKDYETCLRYQRELVSKLQLCGLTKYEAELEAKEVFSAVIAIVEKEI